MKRSRRRPRLGVTGGGRGIVNHAGARLLADVADAVGLTEGLSAAMAPTRERAGGHDRGEVLVDLAVMIADGGETFSDLAALADQPGVFGRVASVPTAWRTLAAVDGPALERIAGVDPGFYVMDFDATRQPIPPHHNCLLKDLG